MSPVAKSRPTKAPHANVCLTSTALAVASLFPVLSFAQAAAPASAASAPAAAASATEGTQTIYVTANRRREPAREVPMQVDRLSAEDLAKGGAKSLIDYLGDQPGVDVNTVGGPGMGAVSIRGVTTGDQTIATVGTYIDDVAYGSSSAFAAGSQTALDMSLLDLNHIEVLRGPQGTLYGAGAMGGVVKYVTNEPDTSELSGQVGLGASATKGGAAGNTVNGVVNVPIKADVAALRLSAFRDHDGGWVDTLGPAAGKNTNKGDTIGGRLAVLVEPSAHFHIRATALSQDIKRDNSDFTDVDPATKAPVDGWNEREQVLREPHSMRTSQGAVDLEYDFGAARLNSITSVQRSKLSQRYDLSAVYAPLINQFFGFTPDTVSEDIAADVHKTTQEFRLTSPAGGAVEWLAGLYWDRETADQKQSVLDTLVGGSPAPDLAELDLISKYQEMAAYGDVTWNATSRLALTGGVRVAQNKQDFTQDASGPLVGGPAPLRHSKETPVTWLGTARYALTPSSNVYVRAASGYRPGGPNAVLNDPATGQPLAPTTFEHDSLWSYEAGYKGDLFDNALSIESAVYDIRWKGIQQVYSVNGIGVIINGGRAEIKGFELGATWRPSARWSVIGHLSTIDGHLTELAPGLGDAGDRLPNSAELAGSLGVKASFDVAGHGGWFGATQRYAGNRDASVGGYRMPEYWLTDVNGGIDFGKVSLSLYVRNLFDARAQLGTSTAEMSLGGPAQVELARPRTVGMTLTASF
jgi:outer membrane receptor protein involved in Fe transport